MTGRRPKAPAKGLVYYPRSHRYRLDGAWTTGVTTILGVLAKDAIPKWAATEVARYVANNRETVDHLYAAGPSVMTAALKEIPWQKRDDAADKGTKIHEFAADLVRGGDVLIPDALVPQAESLLAFMETWSIRPLLIEKPVGHRQHNYAGTVDLVAEFTHPLTGVDAVGIFDYKSGRRIYCETAWQLNGYGHAEFHVDVDLPSPLLPADDIPQTVTGPELPMPAIDEAYGVHVRDDGFDVHPLPYGDDLFAEFVAIREVHAIHKRGKGDWSTPGSGYVGLPVRTDW